MKRVRLYFKQKQDIREEFRYLFEEGEEKICGKSLQYVTKWLDTVGLVTQGRLSKKKEGGKDGRKMRQGIIPIQT